MEPTIIRFGPFELDMRAAELKKRGIRLGLQDQPYQILRMLLDRPGDVVLREEIRARLWPDGTIVEFDHSINAAVKRLRDTLSDSAEKPRYIETLPKRGYRFVGSVEAPPPEPAEPAAEPRTELPRSIVATPVEIVAPPRRMPLTFGLAGLLILAAVIFYATQISGQDWAARTSQVEQLTAAGRYEEAYTLATQVLQHAPEPRVSRLMSELTDELYIVSTPPGAEVFLRRLGSTQVDRIGVTPLRHFTVARGEFILSLRKPGYVDFERTVSSAVPRDKPFNKSPWEIRVQQSLHPAGSVPRGMVAVPGGGYGLRVNSRLTDEKVPLADYFIDKFEVSNRAFKAFVDASGYASPELSKSPAAGLLKDKTGLPGPRGWVGGTLPPGKETHPVTGITWYEASSFCQAAGKKLPTAFQWEKAAREPERGPFGIVVPWGLLKSSDVPVRANFDAAGTAPVDSFEFGMSPVGAYNMAGNVEEWLLNAYDDGFAAGGGAWTDPAYRFGTLGPRPALHSSETLGFRCAMLAVPATGDRDQGGMPFASNRKIPSYPVASDAEFRKLSAHYEYENGPLHATIAGVRENGQWRREEVRFVGYAGDIVTAYLYLPKAAAPPYQVIHYLSGAGWLHGLPLTDSVERSSRMAPYLRSGRAIFMVALKGFFGREPGLYADVEDGSPQHSEAMSSWAVDMRRGVDYLQTRPDIDGHRIALWNDSTTNYATVFAAIEKRYAAVILVGAGLPFDAYERLPPPVNPLRFAPHIRAPKLVLNGLYDDINPQKTKVEPFFRLLSDPKKLVYFEGGHIPPPEIAVPLVKPWLDGTLGAVRGSKAQP